MALFLGRLAAEADDQLDELTLPAPADTPFTDIASLDDEAQAAISVLRQLGVVQGTTPTTYSPDELTSRGQMASFIDRLQGAIQSALGGDPEGFETDLEFFSDTDGSVHEGAINDLASVGIVEGFPAQTIYNPHDAVIRQQMAAFIMRHIEVNVDAGVLDSRYPP